MQLLDDNQTIIGVASRDSVEAMQDFVDRHELGDMVSIADETGDVWARFGIVGQPSWAFVDGETGESQARPGGLGLDGIQAVFANGTF